MKKWIIAPISCLFLFLSSFSLAQSNPNFPLAQSLIEKWFLAMKNQQLDTASSCLAPQFTSLHTDGITRNKQQELQLINALHMQSFRLSDFQFKQSGDLIIVTFKDQGTEQIDHKTINPKAAGRLAILQKQGGQWLIVAYANMDTLN